MHRQGSFNTNSIINTNHKLNFQEFEDYRDADDAVYELNGKELLGERWVVRYKPKYEMTHDCMFYIFAVWLLNPPGVPLVAATATATTIDMVVGGGAGAVVTTKSK